MKVKIVIIALGLCTHFSNAQNAKGEGQFTDPRDGQVYSTFVSYKQVWMTQNLNYDTGKGSWHFMNDKSNGNTCGRLYTWEMAEKACPDGWRLPTKEEIVKLPMFSVRDAINSSYSKDFGYGKLGSGMRLYNGDFLNWAIESSIWSSTIFASEYSWVLRINPSKSEHFVMGTDYKDCGFSVRCMYETMNEFDSLFVQYHKKGVEVKGIPQENLKDKRDGKVYKTVLIGSQTWMAENLNYITNEDSCWCYNNEKKFCKKYGRIYTYETAQNACPAGWHLPSKREFNILLAVLGDSEEHASASFLSGGLSGFNALYGGYKFDGKFRGNENFGSYGDRVACFMTSTKGKEFYFSFEINSYGRVSLSEDKYDNTYGYIRCIKD